MSPVKKPYLKGFKYRIYPNQDQIHLLENTFGCCRYIYNQLLDYNGKQYQQYLTDNTIAKPRVSGFDLTTQLGYLKLDPTKDWLYNVSSVALQQTALDLGAAFQNFFKKRTKYPNFKKKSSNQSFRLTVDGYRLTDKGFLIAKCKSPIKVKWSRDLPSKPSQCTISRTPSGKYYVSFLCEFNPLKTDGKGTLGIDAGITDIATMSDGSSLPNPRHYVKAQKRLKYLQRRLSKKQKGSNNRNKARLKVAKLHEKISNQRKDYLHKLSTKLINENQVIGIESLKVSNMVKNHKLAKHIADAGWSMFRDMLLYKAYLSQHCKIVLADPYFPSTQICSCCGQKPSAKIKLGVKAWKCDSCGAEHHRDHNAAKNLERLARHWFNELRLKPDFKDIAVIVSENYMAVGTTVSACGVSVV